MKGLAALSSIGLVLALVASACQSVCPTIGCWPTIALTYDAPLPGQHTVSVVVGGQTFAATCPLTTEPAIPGISHCDATGLELKGLDLGHGANQIVPVAVTIDGGPRVVGTAALTQILNSRDCDLVCYKHEGILKLGAAGTDAGAP